MIEPKNKDLSIARQCKLVGISRSGFDAPSVGESEANLELMRLIDAQFLETPFCGSARWRGICVVLGMR